MVDILSIETRSLVKKYGNTNAVDEISFIVEEGEIFGFLGPNGAGKSTTMMILATLLKPTSGQALVSGYDISTQPKQVRKNIGYVQQETAVDEFLTGRENLILQAKLNHIPRDKIANRIDDILHLIELEQKQHDPVLTYSGGMRKRLDIAGGLLHTPRVLFLDEPTVGLDIQTRRKIWEYLRTIHNEFNMSIFVSTHYMEEADKLCDRVGIIDHGKIQVIDNPQNMKNQLGNEIIHLTLNHTEELVTKLKTIPSISRVTTGDNKITVYTSDGAKVIPQIFQLSTTLQIKIDAISLTQPTLDDVFISYTGHDLRDESGTFKRKRRLG